MKNLWIIAGALCLAGCSSSPDPAPETTSVEPTSNEVQPQVMATVAPPVVQTPTPAMPPMADANSVLAPIPAPMDAAEQTQGTDDTKRQEVASLRSDMDRLQRQRSTLERQKAEFGVRNPNARTEERATGASSPNDAMMAVFNQQLDDIDSQLRSKQRKIDDLMMSN